MNYDRKNACNLLIRWSVAFVSIFMLVIITVGCAGVNRLREAQDVFNQTAAAENSVRFDFNPADAAANLASVRSGYASALLSLNKIEAEDVKSLQQDGLWGTALTLKALCQWRLGLFSEAIITTEDAQKNAGDQIYPRDRAVLAALPGLIKTDQAYNKIIAKKPLTEVNELLTGERGAVSDIQRARGIVDGKHPVQIYLIQAQLAAYRNFTVAQDRLNNGSTVPAADPVRIAANKQLKELNDLLNVQQPGPAAQALVNYWAKLCYLPVPQ
jgi:hypothetical protein